MVPIGILSIQTILLSRQNDKIDKQNNRLDQQTALLEADRRSAVILESGNVLDAVSRELLQSKDSSLSDPLIGRIISLSRAMKEYRYLDPEADTLLKEAISPERGHLLVALYNSKLSQETYLKIYKGADFSKADLKGANLTHANLRGADLRGANLTNANLQRIDLSDANLEGVNLKKSWLMNADLRNADLRNSDLSYADLTDVTLLDDQLRGNLRDNDNLQPKRQGKTLSFTLPEPMPGDRNVRVTTDLLEGAKLKNAHIFREQLQDFLDSKADTTGISFAKKIGY